MILKLKYPYFPAKYLSDFTKISDAFSCGNGYTVEPKLKTLFWAYVVEIKYNDKYVDYIALYQSVEKYTVQGNNYFNDLDSAINFLLVKTCQLQK